MQRLRRFLSCVTFLLVLTASVTHSAIQLRVRTIDPKLEPAYDGRSLQWKRNELDFDAGLQQPRPFLITLTENDKIFSRSRLEEELELHGEKLLYYIPDHSYLIQVSPLRALALKSERWIQWIGALEPNDKISPQFKKGKPSAANSLAVQLITPSICLDAWRPTSCLLNFLEKEWLSNGLFESVALPSASVAKVRLNKTRTQSILPAIQWLSERPEVLWIEPVRPPATPQMKYAAAVTWAMLPPPQGPNGSAVTWVVPEQMDEFLLLRGEGQVIGMADTGLDVNSCFFSDPAVPMQYNVSLPQHRKVILYNPLVDQGDAPNGHGTHTASLAVGDCSPFHPEHRGIASAAKIAFVDVGDIDENLQIPTDVRVIYDATYAAGARIHSDSWGAPPQSEYSTDSMILDQYMWDHPDFLLIRAAGNEGSTAGASITSEATAKNSIAVGASVTTTPGLKEALNYRDFTLSVGNLMDQLCVRNQSYCTANVTQELCCSEPLLQRACCIPTVAAFLDPELDCEYSMASFSSRGPTHDGRVKPDIVAPGRYIVGARAGGNGTGLLALAGTSASTPITAGAAAIIRQYFVEGHYISTDATSEMKSANTFEPSAALLKAMLIASAHPLTGLAIVDDVVRVMPMGGPFAGTTMVDGFGKISLSSVLPDMASSAFSLQVPNTIDRVIVQGQNHSYCFRTSVSGTVRAVLVWTDFPGLPLAQRQLVNDLDLEVITDFETVFGNQPLFPNLAERVHDSINNVERAEAQVTAGASFSVVVRGTRVPQDPQKYALVIIAPPQTTVNPICVECTDGRFLPCSVPHGTGLSKCIDGRWQKKCGVSSCSRGYTIDSWKGGCRPFYSFYVVIAVVAIIFIVVNVLVCIPFAVYFDRTASKLPRDPKKPPQFWDLFSVFRPKLAIIVTGSTLVLIGNTFSLVQPLFLGQVLSKVATAAFFSDMMWDFYLLIGVVVAEFFFSTLGDYFMSLANLSVLRLLRYSLFCGILRRNYGDLENIDRGEMQNRLMMDASMSVAFPCNILVSVFSGLIKTIMGLVMIVLISWQLTIAFLAMVPVLGLLAYFHGKLIAPKTTSQLTAVSELSSAIHDSFINLKTVKLFCAEEHEKDIMRYFNKQFFNASRVSYLVGAMSNSGRVLVLQCFTLGLLAYGCLLVMRNSITTSLLVTFFLYVAMAAAGVNTIINLFPGYHGTLGALSRIYELASLGTDGRDLYGAAQDDHATRKERVKKRSSLSGPVRKGPLHKEVEIHCKAVAFAYPATPKRLVFQELNLELLPGKIYAIIGPSGTGKSTLFNLLCRVYNPVRGVINLNGKDSKAYDIKDYLGMISVVEQNPRMFHRTLHDNLVYGVWSVPDAEVKHALKTVNLDGMIPTLPQGLATKIGENSNYSLSGGQKQRVAIARAMLKNAPLVLMDEPTSGLDAENQKIVMNAIFALKKQQKTIVMITHLLSSIAEADEIIFLQNGRVAERGTHEQLMRMRGAYLRFLEISFSFSGGIPHNLKMYRSDAPPPGKGPPVRRSRSRSRSPPNRGGPPHRRTPPHMRRQSRSPPNRGPPNQQRRSRSPPNRGPPDRSPNRRTPPQMRRSRSPPNNNRRTPPHMRRRSRSRSPPNRGPAQNQHRRSRSPPTRGPPNGQRRSRSRSPANNRRTPPHMRRGSRSRSPPNRGGPANQPGRPPMRRSRSRSRSPPNRGRPPASSRSASPPNRGGPPRNNAGNRSRSRTPPPNQREGPSQNNRPPNTPAQQQRRSRSRSPPDLIKQQREPTGMSPPPQAGARHPSPPNVLYEPPKPKVASGTKPQRPQTPPRVEPIELQPLNGAFDSERVSPQARRDEVPNVVTVPGHTRSPDPDESDEDEEDIFVPSVDEFNITAGIGGDLTNTQVGPWAKKHMTFMQDPTLQQRGAVSKLFKRNPSVKPPSGKPASGKRPTQRF